MRILIQNCAVARLIGDSETYSLYILLCNYTPALVICLVFLKENLRFFIQIIADYIKFIPFLLYGILCFIAILAIYGNTLAFLYIKNCDFLYKRFSNNHCIYDKKHGGYPSWITAALSLFYLKNKPFNFVRL